jgi:hypothetical protein
MNPHNPNLNINLSVSLTTPIQPRRSQSQSVAVIKRVCGFHSRGNYSPDRIPSAPLENSVKLFPAQRLPMKNFVSHPRLVRGEMFAFIG